MLADVNKFDSMQDWLKGLTWDGVPRVDSFLHKFARAEDTPYHTAVSRYLWTALAGRTLDPGVKADMVPVFIGKQGLGKTTLVENLAPGREYFVSLDFSRNDNDLTRMLRGKVVAEIGELRGLSRREVDGVKAFISERVDEWVPKYSEHAIKYPRRSVFVATTNRETFINDPTGSRRWLPVRLTKRANITRMREVIPQLWAEAASLYAINRVAFTEAEQLADNKPFNRVEPWARAVHTWLEANKTGVVTTEAILISAIGIPLDRHTQAHYNNVEMIMRPLGYVTAYNPVTGTYWSKA